MPRKPIINISGGVKIIPTRDGDAETFTSLSALPRKESFWSKFGNFFFLGGGLILLLTFVFGVGYWKAIYDNRLNRIERDIEDIKRHNNSSDIKGLIGLINEKLTKKRKSSYGVVYYLKYNICEFNEAYGHWNDIPRLGQFVEITNMDNQLKTLCMIVGSYSDNINLNRILVVSKTVASNLDFKGGLLSVKIRYLPEIEIKTRKDCLELRRTYNINFNDN